MLAVADHIEVDEKGVARIAGSRIKVALLIRDAKYHGWGVPELHAQFPHLTLAQLHAAFVYYHDHQKEIEDYIQAGDDFVKEMREKHGKNQPTLAELRARSIK